MGQTAESNVTREPKTGRIHPIPRGRSRPLRWWQAEDLPRPAKRQFQRDSMPSNPKMRTGRDGLQRFGKRYFQNRYLSPRPPFTTLQLPVQGHRRMVPPDADGEIDDSRLRALVGADSLLHTSLGIPFFDAARGGANIRYLAVGQLSGRNAGRVAVGRHTPI